MPSHQNFGALTVFWVDFNKIGIYQGYIKTFRNKEKIKFLMLVLESKKINDILEGCSGES